MIMKKERLGFFDGNCLYDIYEPESLIKEASNIQEALKPLGFEVIGIRQKCPCDAFVLHLRPYPPVIASVGITDPGENTPPLK